ncbi:hypothetical protein NE237_031827 [Protea cynaroides]|uniref:Uncharacterized protein n=1 Tax=Protea cynaroides TaxID=273540 RepID=A0A9Q0L2A3_9MAGN|nr:hypothetical protein NE237_031827 [Protea cynaroides]
MCYVGKATKIFIVIIAMLLGIGFILGFGLFRHGFQKNQKCSNNSCNSPSPVFSSPCNGGNCQPPLSPNPIPATATAVPPNYPPPSSEVVPQGPVQAQVQLSD